MFFKAVKNAWTSNLKWCNYGVCPVEVSSLFKAAVDNFCKQASKLMLAGALDSSGSKSAAAVCASSHFILFVVGLLSPV